MQNKSKTYKMAVCSLFVTLIIAGAFIKIPVPVVPFTLQFLFTMLAAIFLGGRLGSLSVIVYMILGLVGVPVFSSGGGLGYVLVPSFGYIIGFIIGTYVEGTLLEKKERLSYGSILICNFINLIIVYLTGMAYYYLVCNYVLGTPIGFWPLILYCFIMVVPGDIVLCLISAYLGKRLIPVVKGM